MIQRICVFTSSYSPNKQAMLDYFEKTFPENIKIFLFTPKDHKYKYKLKRTIIANTNCTKINSSFELRRFCKQHKIQRIINIGQLPYEAFVMVYASWLTPTDFLTYHLGNPIDSLTLEDLKTRIRSTLEAIASFIFSIFPKKIILISENQSTRIKKYLPHAKNKIYFLYPTIPTNLFKPKDKMEARKKLNLPNNKPIILFIGRIGYLKGSDILIELIKRNPDKNFILIGEIVDKNLNKILNQQNFNNLTLINSKTHEEIVDYYNASDLFIFPSRIEGSPLAPREAMSSGIPTLVSKMPSTKLIKPIAIRTQLNPNDFNQQLNNFFNLSKEERNQISKKSRDLIIDRFDDEKWKERYKRIILS